MKSNSLLLIGGLVSIFGCNSCSQDTTTDKIFDNSVVSTVNLDQYLGIWYEIARYDHRFERDMEGVKAQYSMRDDGLIKVLNGKTLAIEANATYYCSCLKSVDHLKQYTSHLKQLNAYTTEHLSIPFCFFF